MTSSNPGSGRVQIKDSTGKVIFAALLVGVKVTNEEDMLTLQAADIKDIVVADVATGSVVPSVNLSQP